MFVFYFNEKKKFRNFYNANTKNKLISAQNDSYKRQRFKINNMNQKYKLTE